jgi:hypothetical protein
MAAREMDNVAEQLRRLARDAGDVLPTLGREERWRLGWVRSRALRALEDLSTALYCQKLLDQDGTLDPRRRQMLQECLVVALRETRAVLAQPFEAPWLPSPAFVSRYLGFAK